MFDLSVGLQVAKIYMEAETRMAVQSTESRALPCSHHTGLDRTLELFMSTYFLYGK